MTKHKKIEQKVLKVYRKVSPSIIEIQSESNKINFEKRRRNIFKSLGIPTQTFRGKKIIDIGGGTGEKSMHYALWGGDVTIVEPNEKSCSYANKLFSSAGLKNKLKIINKSLYEFDASIIQDFDIVICEGVLHHTYNPIKGLDLIIKNAKNNALVYIAMAESHGWFKRNLQRKLINELAGIDEKKIIEISRKYFRDHINRAMKYGMRPEMTIIYDSYVLSQVKPVTLENICNTFYKNKVSYLSAFPTLDLFYLTVPWSKEIKDHFSYKFFKKYYQFLEKVWMTCGEERIINDLRNFNFSSIKERVEQDVRTLLTLEQRIENGKYTMKDLSPIRKGYLGVGMNYFVGVKEVK
ncbi:MAG: methyltransferase domain-containing protein [Thaumarchaeota archaeon]|nr:methyltransferase domain-containing protein [Nitrososphaerota archaeon]